jgi:hypothetical protein
MYQAGLHLGGGVVPEIYSVALICISLSSKCLVISVLNYNIFKINTTPTG